MVPGMIREQATRGPLTDEAKPVKFTDLASESGAPIHVLRCNVNKFKAARGSRSAGYSPDSEPSFNDASPGQPRFRGRR